jgi:hypothetical protein
MSADKYIALDVHMATVVASVLDGSKELLRYYPVPLGGVEKSARLRLRRAVDPLFSTT